MTLDDKIEQSIHIITEALDLCRNPYLAWSGGKDSTALAHLVHQVEPGVEMVYCDDELLYPEHVDFVRAYIDAAANAPYRLRVVSGGGLHRGWFRPWNDRFIWWRMPEPEMEWLPRVDRHTGEIAKLASYLGYDGVFLGLRRAESIRRYGILKAATGIDRVRGYWHVNPLLDWTDGDVWAYIDRTGLAYCAVYDRLAEIGVGQHHQRVGPLPLSEGTHLWRGWPQMYAALVRRYGLRWTQPVGKRPPKGVDMLDWLDIQDAIREAR